VTPLVLVHGSGLDARSWDLVVEHLDGPSLAVDLPGRSAFTERGQRSAIVAATDSVERDVVAADLDDVVLVAHSMAGCAVPAMLERFGERVRHVVFVVAAVPDDGATSMDIVATDVRERRREMGGAAVLRELFGNDMDDGQFEHYLGLVNDDPPGMAMEPVALGGLHEWSGTCSYVRTLRDQLFRLPFQDRFVGNVGRPCEVIDLDAGHVCMVSQPKALAAILNDAAGG
jgi:pimeloyl-ACP methyl ester carboxylesterase